MQTSLITPDPLSPLPTDSSHYVVALQNKFGERDALRNVSQDAWARMTPLIQFVGPKSGKKPTAPTVRNWVREVAGAVGEHPVYIDLLRLDPATRTKVGSTSLPVLEVMYAAARKRGMRFVPVAWVGQSSDEHLRCVAEAAAEDGQGVALRYRVNATVLPTGTSPAQYLERLVVRLQAEIVTTDLFLDLGFFHPDVDVGADDIGSVIGELDEIGQWRSLVLLGTSIPRMMSCIKEDTLGPLQRREWDLWVELARTDSLKRIPAFGDYAIQHPHPPLDGGPGMRANIRYTTRRSTLVARGRSVLQEGKEQYRRLCQQLVECEDFAGAGYSWGDAVISECALGEREPGAQGVWRGAGTSHHLELVTDQLREHRAAA